MCDYSLMSYKTRLAEDGEKLVLHRFPSSTLGLVSQDDLMLEKQAKAAISAMPIWKRIKAWFTVEDVCNIPAVCVPPGATLFLRNISERGQKNFQLKPEEKVSFVQLSANANQYRDAFRFADGREILLQKLEPGLQVDVIQIALPEEIEQPEPAVSLRTFVVAQ